MKFKLIINGSGARKLDEVILIDAINKLPGEDGDFIILEPKEPIENNVYLQAMYDEDAHNYLVETRFIFSNEDDFKHFQYITQSLDEVRTMFLDYFNECKLPPVHKWLNDTDSFTEESDEDMCKLYKKVENELHYFEFWISDENELTIHKGIVGDIGETNVITIGVGDLPLKIQMAKFESDCRQQGYDTVANLTELIIQYPCDKLIDLEEKQEEVEVLMNECLGWTGNGHCDGGDIDTKVMNIFCYVANKDIALETILETLRDNDLLENVIIAYADEKTEEFEMLYPAKTGRLEIY